MSIADTNYAFNRIARTIQRADATITENADRIIADMQRAKDGIAAGHRLEELHGQRVTDFNRAVIQRQAAWDMVAVLEIDEDAMTAAVREA